MKSGTQILQLLQGQPQSPKGPYIFKPKSQFQEFKQLRDGKQLENVDISSIKAESVANSSDYLIAQEWAQKQGLYDLNIIMKTKAYRNDNLQRIVKYQNPKLDQANVGDFILGATANSKSINIKQEFQQMYEQNIQQALQISGENSITIQIFYNYKIWKAITSGYEKQDKIIQIAKLYNEEQDPNSHFQKLATCIHRYIQKICREATAIEKNNQQYILIETIIQQSDLDNQNHKKIVAETPMTIETLRFQGNDQKYIIIFIDYECLK